MITVPLGEGMVCIGAVSNPITGKMGILLRPTDKPEAIGSVVKTNAAFGVFIQCGSLESLAVLERKIAELKHMIRARDRAKEEAT